MANAERRGLAGEFDVELDAIVGGTSTGLLWMQPVMLINRPREERRIYEMRWSWSVEIFISGSVILMLYRGGLWLRYPYFY